MQQGRVQFDADWNEQADISGHFLQALARDLVGPHGGPGNSFKVEGKLRRKALRHDFAIREGHYYVDGLLCENDEACTYTTQPDYKPPNSQLLRKDGEYLVYLDVWQRAINYVNDPEIREIALGGADTATRTKIVWQVKVVRLGSPRTKGRKNLATSLLNGLVRVRLPTLEPRTHGQPNDLPPQAGYTGLENQLYRVEIHDSGSGSDNTTFKWSRDNGSVVTSILKIQGRIVTVAPWAGHEGMPLVPRDWVEVSDDEYELLGRAEPLCRVESVDLRKMQVILGFPPPSGIGTALERHPIMRRWDQKEDTNAQMGPRNGTITVAPNKWVLLECGIQVRFSRGEYRTGDYWLIPARVANKSVIWPNRRGKPVPMSPQGICHHYCPLATLRSKSNGEITEIEDWRRIICPSESSL